MKLLFMSSLLFVYSCATVVNGKKEMFEVKTLPEGATVKINGQSCESPCSFELNRGTNYVVKIQKEGYQEKKIKIDGKSMDGWLWGNILLGGVIGLAVDYGSGAAYDFEPEGLDLILRKEENKEVNRSIASEPSTK